MNRTRTDQQDSIGTLATRGAILGLVTGLLFGGAEVFFSSLFAEIYLNTYLLMILLHAAGGSVFGAAFLVATGFCQKLFFKKNLVSTGTAFHASIVLAGFIFLYGFYYLNEKVLAGQSLFSFSSLSASVILFFLCCGLAAILYRFNNKKDFSSFVTAHAAMSSLAIVMLVGMTFYFLGWGAPPRGFLQIAGVMLSFVMMPLFGFLIEHGFGKLLSSKLQKSSAGVVMRIAVLFFAGLAGMSLLGPPSLSGVDENNGEPATAEMKNLSGKPNIIWIVIDTARRDRLSLYGYHRNTTPNLDAFAKDAVVFNRAISAAPWTAPSHASMFTGTFVSKHGAHYAEGEVYCRPLSSANLTLAELMSAAGYHTAGIAANNAGLFSRLKIDQGFQTYLAVMPATSSLFWGKLIDQLPAQFRNNDLRYNEVRLSSEINLIVNRWLDRHAESPFFLFINYMEAHGGIGHIPQPYDSLFGFSRDVHDKVFAGFDPAKVTRKEVAVTPEQKRFYDDYADRKIAFMDHNIGLLLDDLKARKIYDETMIIVVSDHGNLDGEHFSFGHNTELYDILIHVPLIIKYPKSMQRTGMMDRFVSTVDIMPEVLKISGLPIPEEVQGQPFDEAVHEIISELFEQRTNAHAKLNPERYYRDLRAIYSKDDRNFKYIQASNGNSELYVLTADPDELENLFAQRPEIIAELDARLEEWRASFEPVQDDDHRETTDTEKLMERLRALGYVK